MKYSHTNFRVKKQSEYNLDYNKNMDLKEFLENFADQFDETDPSKIKIDTKFHDLEEWSSLTGMGVIAMAKTEYGKSISGKELRECVTVEDVFNLIASK